MGEKEPHAPYLRSDLRGVPGDGGADAAGANDDHVVRAVGLGGRVARARARAGATADAAVGAILDREVRRALLDVHLCQERGWDGRLAEPRASASLGPSAAWAVLTNHTDLSTRTPTHSPPTKAPPSPCALFSTATADSSWILFIPSSGILPVDQSHSSPSSSSPSCRARAAPPPQQPPRSPLMVR